MPTRLLLVRHGEARCNIDGTWAGHATCTGLTDTGRRQAHEVGTAVASALEGGLVVVSSAMPRAIETAAVAVPGSTARVDCGVCERHPGNLDGRRVEDLAATGDGYTALDGEETVLAFARRVRRALTALAQPTGEGTTVIVTHSGVIALSLGILGDVRDRRVFETIPAHASITEWRRVAGDRWDLVRFGDVDHLGAVTGAAP